MTNEIQNQSGYFKKNWLFFAIIAILIGFAGYLALSKNSALKKQTKSFSLEKSNLIREAQILLETNSKSHLNLMMKTLTWAVRGEMIRGNQEQVGQYFNELVKIDQIEEVFLVDMTENVLISTNKKNEGTIFKPEYSIDILNVDETTILDQEGKSIIASPVLSIDSRLGTLIIIYKTDVFNLD